MFTLGYFPHPLAECLGVLTVLFAAGIYLDGDRNDVVSWPWALATLIISPFVLVLYILFRIVLARSVNIWADPKTTRRDEHSPSKLPSIWGGSRKRRSTKGKGNRPQI
jgi:hypothetical protein